VKGQVDPIPDEFTSYDEAAEFWDSHDTMDYPDGFCPVDPEDGQSEGGRADGRHHRKERAKNEKGQIGI